MKKLLSIVLASVLTFSALTGCAKTQEQADSGATGTTETADAGEAATAPSDGEQVEIVVLHGQPEEPRVKAIQSIMDDFMAKYPNVKVTQMAVPEDALWTKITTLTSAGELPAIVEGGIDQLRLMNNDEALDLEGTTEAIEKIGKDRYFEGAIEMAKAPDGENYIGVPVSGFVAGLWYRTDWFEEKGLSAPKSWADITAAAKVFNDQANKQYGIVFATEESEFTEQTFTPFALSNDALLFDKDGKPQFNSPEMREAVEMYTSLYEYCIPGSNSFDEVKDPFVGGHAAMAMYSTYMMSALYDAGLADKVAMAPIAKNHESTFGGISTLGLSNMISDAEREAAINFLAFMTEPEQNIKWVHMSPGGSNPVLKDVADDPAYLENDLLKAFGDTARAIPQSFESMEGLGFQDGKPNPAMGNISGKFIIPHCLKSIMVDGTDIDTAIQAAQAAMEEEAAEF